ncbi:MAG: hypothetical protein N4A47_06005 [Clostridia bacterium]|jgi:hypothetical protein|nr:hypothetical protein [Clostridia bacterium]
MISNILSRRKEEVKNINYDKNYEFLISSYNFECGKRLMNAFEKEIDKSSKSAIEDLKYFSVGATILGVFPDRFFPIVAGSFLTYKGAKTFVGDNIAKKMNEQRLLDEKELYMKSFKEKFESKVDRRFDPDGPMSIYLECFDTSPDVVVKSVDNIGESKVATCQLEEFGIEMSIEGGNVYLG